MDSKLDPQKFAKKDLYKLFALSPSSTNDEAHELFFTSLLFHLDYFLPTTGSYFS